jgi:MFS transporter, ACS family, glucarate transporter
MGEATDQASSVPTRARKTVVRLGVSLAFLAFLDRTCISQAAPEIMRDLHLSKLQMGYAFSAFGLTYAALEIPAGWLCDRFGTRILLSRVVLCWSVLTAATGVAWSFASLAVIRLLFGAGEAGCFPGLATCFSRWLPRDERAVAEGWKAAAMGRWGAAVAPYLVVTLYALMGWRQTFFVFGAVGLFWAAAFWCWYRDRPDQHAGVNAAELALIKADSLPADLITARSPWKQFAASGSAWALCIQWFCHYYGFYFYVTWLPTYLQQARGLNVKTSALLAGMPMLLAGAGTLASGYLLPFLSLRFGTAAARKGIAYASYGGASLLLFVFTAIHNPIVAMLVMSLSSFAVEFSTPVTWTTAMDLGGKSVGTLTGAMNCTGQIGASAAPAAIGYILTASHNNWLLTFYLSSLVYAGGLLCWVFLDPIRRLDVDRPSAHPV